MIGFKSESVISPKASFSLPLLRLQRTKGVGSIYVAMSLSLGMVLIPVAIRAESASLPKPGWYMGVRSGGATLAFRLQTSSDRTYLVTGILGNAASTQYQFPVHGEYDPGSNLLAAVVIFKNSPNSPIVGSYDRASRAFNLTVSNKAGRKLAFSCRRAKQPEKSLAGTWTMTDGTVIHVQQDGSTVTGTFAGAAVGITAGHLQGEFDGTTFKGTFSNKLTLGGEPMSIHGTFVMTLVDANKLHGRWHATNGVSEDVTATRSP